MWFSSYDHFRDIICKTPSGGQNVIFLFFDNFLKTLCLFTERESLQFWSWDFAAVKLKGVICYLF